MINNPKPIKCPTCQKEIFYSPDNIFRPFCSERCKLIDLGAWAAEEHRVEGQDLILDEFMSDEELNDILSKKLH